MTQIIARSTLISGTGTRPGRIVLYVREHPFHPYVVHNVLEEDGSKFQGTYTGSIAEAATEFERRCRGHGVRDERLEPTGAGV